LLFAGLLAVLLTWAHAAQVVAGEKAARKSGASKPRACASSAECAAGERCTTEDGACNRPPGCGPRDICPTVCYGVCSTKKKAPDAGR
jgi:hypothetical protein